MAHIVYGGQAYPLAPNSADQIRAAIKDILRTGSWGELNLGSVREEYETHIFVMPGVPIAVHSWDLDEPDPRLVP
ncbi:hypothetical protein H9623_13225 [Oerskovia sp. Sa1BUA8]|uniref:Uncharacterized protein n=1 Tax=Oerskovia douganii TaxID=2762210 RepID=A0A9D5UDW0_9CELL|nr:hypothetical protein [Oerskovia douganii]MBE7701256.1 hypothetical protein [Oerskovia douganii]